MANSHDDLTAELDRLLLSDPAAIVDPYPLWSQLREEAPILFHDDAWIVSRSENIRALLDHKSLGFDLAISGRRAEAIRNRLSPADRLLFDEISAFEALYVSRNDGPRHDRLRSIAQRTFTPGRVAKIKVRVEELCHKLLDELAVSERPDLRRFAFQLPLIVMCEMFDIPESDLDIVHHWSNCLGNNRGGNNVEALRSAHQAMGEFRAYVEKLITDLKSRPRDHEDQSLVGDLIDASDGDALTGDELTAMIVVLLFAGHETTTNLIATGVLELLKSGEWGKLRDQPDLIPGAVEELVRFVSPVQWVGRVVRDPIEMGEVTLESGDTVLLMLAAGNRDPRALEAPDTLNVTRKGIRNHLGFGMGSHFCMGSPLARIEASIAVKVLVERFPNMALTGEPLRFTGNAKLRTLERLPVELGA